MSSPQTTQLQRKALHQLLQLGVELASELELDRLLELILRGATDLLDASDSHLYRYHPDRDVLATWIPFRLPEGVVALKLARGEGAAGAVLATGKALRLDDYDSWPGRTAKWPIVSIARGQSSSATANSPTTLPTS